MPNCCFLRQIVQIITILFIITKFICAQDSDLILELRKNYLSGNLSVKDIIESQEFDFPYNILAEITLFEIYSDQKNITKMLELYNKNYNYYPISQLLNYRIGLYYYNNKDFVNAKEKFNECIKKDSRFFEAREYLAKCYNQIKDFKQAYRHYNVISWFDTKNKEIQKELYRLSTYINLPIPVYNKNFSYNIAQNISATTFLQNTPKIKIGISTKDNGSILNIDTVKLKCSDDFFILNDKDKIVLNCPSVTESDKKKLKTDSWKIVYKKKLESIAIISPYLNKEYRIKSKYITLKSSNPYATFLIEEYGNFKHKLPQFKEYRDEIILKQFKNNLIVINNTYLDHYLYGVVAKEIGSDKPVEALKAQAVVARTVAMYSKINKLHKEYDLCSGQHCQVYDGIRDDKDTVVNAVNSTYGEIIVHNSTRPIHAFFHANCGGYTQNSQSAGWRTLNYLQNVSDIVGATNYNVNDNLYIWFLFPPKLYCEESDYVHAGTSRWFRIIKKSVLSRNLNLQLNIGDLKDIQVLSRSSSGYINKIKIVGSNKNITLSNESRIRKIFFNTGLRSTAFLLEYNKNNDSYYFWGGGWGHGVGMCQSGACGLAERGENYINIIKYYYPEIEVLKIY